MTQSVQNLIYQPARPLRMQVDLNASQDLLDISFQLEDIDDEALPGLLLALQQNRKYYRLSAGKILNFTGLGFSNTLMKLSKL